MGATIVVDALWGDSGKGKVAAYVALQQRAAFCVRAGTGTNAGHSIYFEDGSEIRTHQLCCGWLHPGTQIRIGSGVAVDPEILVREIQRYKLAERTRVDLRCPVIAPEHRAREKGDRHLAATLGSVCSGSGAARADFVLRKASQARDVRNLEKFLTDVPREINTACRDGAGRRHRIQPGHPPVARADRGLPLLHVRQLHCRRRSGRRGPELAIHKGRHSRGQGRTQPCGRGPAAVRNGDRRAGQKGHCRIRRHDRSTSQKITRDLLGAL